MNIKDRLAADIKRIVATHGAGFQSAYDARITANIAPHAAFHQTAAELRKKAVAAANTEKRADESDAGMADAEGDAEEPMVYGCTRCGTRQPACVCPACLVDGPPGYCFACGSGVAPYGCSNCGTAWAPALAEDIQEGDMLRAIPFPCVEIRAFPDRGELIGWATSDIKDAHGTRIAPDEVLRWLKTGAVGIDEEHNFTQVRGVTLVEVHGSKRPFKNADGKEVLTEGVGFTQRCDLSIPEARSYYEKFKDGTYKGFSIAFRMASALKKRIKAGVTDFVDKIEAMPCLSAVSDPSNPAATLLEMRSKFALRPVEAPTEIKPPADQPADRTTKLAALTADLDALKPTPVETTSTEMRDAKTEKAPEAAPVSPATPVAGPDLATLVSRIDALSNQVAELRSAAPSREWEPGLVELRSGIEALTVSLQSELAKQAKDLDETISSLVRVVPELRNFVQQQLAALKLPAPRAASHTATGESPALDALKKLESDRQKVQPTRHDVGRPVMAVSPP